MYYSSSTDTQIREIACRFVKTLNNKLKGMPNFWITKVSYGCKTYVRSDFAIVLDVDDIERYAEMNSISIEAATKLLLSHEIFHILLGHFGDKYKDYDKNLLNIAGDLEINSYLGIEHPGLMASDYGWSALLSTDAYYQKLLELIEEQKEEAENEEESISIQISLGNKNQDSDSEESSMSEKTDSMEDLEDSDSTDSDEFDNEGEDSIDGAEEDDEDYDEEWESEEMDEEETEDGDDFNDMMERDYGLDIPDEVVINTATSDYLEENNETINPSCSIDDLFNAKKVLKEVAKKCLNEYKKYSLEGLDKIMSKLIRTENEKAIVPHTKKATYYKLNNRRKSDFILPGKKLEGGATKKKFDRSLTVFIDVSSSTCGSIASNLSKVAYKLYEQGATIVYYNTYIVDVVKSTQGFKKCKAYGGTNIKNVVSDYMEQYGKLERVYVFTDGYDDFTEMSEICDKYKIFYIGYKNNNTTYQRKLACWEKFSNTNPQKNRWE